MTTTHATVSFQKICDAVRRAALRAGDLSHRTLAIADACAGSFRAGRNAARDGGTHTIYASTVRGMLERGWVEVDGQDPETGSPWYRLTPSGRARLARVYEDMARLIQEAAP